MKKLIVILLLFVSFNCFAQLRDTVYRVTPAKKTVIIPLSYFLNGTGYRLYEYPCFTLKSFHQNDSLSISGSSLETDSTGFNIALKRWDLDSLITSGVIYFAGQTSGKEYQYMPFTPALKFLIFKGNNAMTDTVYVRTLFKFQ